MFFAKISSLWRADNYIFIRAEYHNIKFHINEIKTLQIVNKDNLERDTSELPLRNAKILFILKSGRKKTCYVRKLTKRKYIWLLNLLDGQL